MYGRSSRAYRFSCPVTDLLKFLDNTVSNELAALQKLCVHEKISGGELTMIEIAAFVLCKLGGKAGNSDEIKAVLEAAGASADDDTIAKLCGDVEGKDINELLAAGAEQIKDVPFGGGGGGGGGGAGEIFQLFFNAYSRCPSDILHILWTFPVSRWRRCVRRRRSNGC
jgi:ribosomal protein L12E/L44/L45/RPP1/RPP2